MLKKPRACDGWAWSCNWAVLGFSIVARKAACATTYLADSLAAMWLAASIRIRVSGSAGAVEAAPAKSEMDCEGEENLVGRNEGKRCCFIELGRREVGREGSSERGAPPWVVVDARARSSATTSVNR